MSSIDNMTEKELKAERERLKALVNSEEATCGDALRLAEVLTSLKIINHVRNGHGLGYTLYDVPIRDHLVNPQEPTT